MKAHKVKKQIKKLQGLLHEQFLVKATLKMMKQDEDQRKLDITPEMAQYRKNLEKRLLTIEIAFEKILKE